MQTRSCVARTRTFRLVYLSSVPVNNLAARVGHARRSVSWRIQSIVMHHSFVFRKIRVHEAASGCSLYI